MIPQAVVPDCKFVKVHSAGGYAQGAIDIYAPPKSEVLAPGPGRVVRTAQSPAVPNSYQIQGYIKRPDGMEVPFVAAHFISGTYIGGGRTFEKGAVLGRIRRWDQYPNSTHVHFSFRRAGETKLPPPGNVLVMQAFKRFGVMN
jgi:hypothetical protein